MRKQNSSEKSTDSIESGSVNTKKISLQDAFLIVKSVLTLRLIMAELSFR